MQLIVLWDVDHTLVENAGVSKEIYASAFKALAKREAELPAPTEGRTDRAIMREMFVQHGLPVPAWDRAQRALEQAGRDREEDLRQRGHVLPGAQEALKALAADSAVCSSVLTGNISANARVKLRAFGLDSLLDMAVGGYGEDSDNRARLVDTARARIHAARGIPLVAPTVLIGDTPRDVRAAHDARARCIAVASGIHSVAELHAAGADVVLADLTDTEDLLTCLRTTLT
ncbi:HAD family hydrolase [Streptomyces sp. NBC_00582]|uniref:HAD family hydrolase n=1 Tax=Streptomyces sp. NBC_00582 TaxID=2975783 RepID=UPI002E8140FB|nr:HAD hydrolase-like protein [Streptomyces sp. NBC_00582]WUB60743.1 haloacid dehalogenase-like hydrolase [Streptomyces sp. NBC_00582]